MLTGAPARVARALLEGGPATVSELAERLELTGAAVRKHIDDLVASGLVEGSDRPPFGPASPRGRGRPARIYHLTQAGRDGFEQAYDDLAVAALRFLAETGGDAAVMAFARRRVHDLERRYASRLDGCASTAERAHALADLLSADGYAAVVSPSGMGGVQLCQRNCPVAHVAAEFPQFCEAESEAFGRLVGTHVTRLATLSRGDGVCTTHIPSRSAAEITSEDHPARVAVAANPGGTR